jgi:hypothetical protein
VEDGEHVPGVLQLDRAVAEVFDEFAESFRRDSLVDILSVFPSTLG